ncbi:MAG: DNA methyltransferase [Salinigranum sp.]
MASEDSRPAERSVYTQFGGVEMDREGETVYPDFRFEENPGVNEPPATRPGYPLGPVPASGDVEYAYPGEPDRHPEMDFRRLANDLEDGRAVPNTTYLTHAIHKHPAIFIPHIPSYVIRRFTAARNEDGERPLVLDPFSGSGTTGVEAKVAGRDYLGIEINPLSRLVSEVATTPIPPSLLARVESEIVDALAATDERRYPEYDVEFPDRTDKEHWFEDRAIRDLTRIRKVVSAFELDVVDSEGVLTPGERRALDDASIDRAAVEGRLYRWLVLTVADTVFDVSNADPGISKAYRSKRMRRKIADGDHPPGVVDTFERSLAESRRKLATLWDEVYGATEPRPLADNAAHRATVDIRLGDARTFEVTEHLEGVDLAVTSPPYINAMNYYRGTKLRLFWIRDLLEGDDLFDADRLKRSIVGTTTVSMRQLDRDLPASLRSVWAGSDEAFERTRLPYLDRVIERIHDSGYASAEKNGYVTWRFFAEDVLRALARTYEHLKPGGYFFFLIGENTICEQSVPCHKFVADIARNLGRFRGHGGDFDPDDGFRLVGSMWDEISNRDLFRNRNHEGGVIECEWMVVLQKPRDD